MVLHPYERIQSLSHFKTLWHTVLHFAFSHSMLIAITARKEYNDNGYVNDG